MKKYEFRVTLRGNAELTDEIADDLFAAGCSDGSPGTCDGVFAIDFRHQSPSLEAAICSSVADVERAGYRVAHVALDRHALLHPESLSASRLRTSPYSGGN